MEQVHHRASLLAGLSESLTAKRPHSLVQKRQKRMLNLTASLQARSTQAISTAKSLVDTLEGKLEAIDPKCVLQRGFTLTEDSSGALVRSIRDVKDGQKIRTVLADGTIDSKVECTT
jgi:exodeoxyribonuclease VII large subunit